MPAPDLQQLLELFQSRRFNDMEQLARRVLQQSGDDGIVWKALGVALQAQGRDAVAALQRGAALLPGDAELRGNLIEAHLRRGHALMKADRCEDAAASYTEARRLDASHPHAHACLGVALQSLGRLEAAVRSFDAAVKLRPDLVDAQFCLGSCLLALGRAEEALQCLQRVLTLKPDHGPAHANRANALKALDRLDEALPAYRRAIALQPGVASNHANLAAACRELGLMEEALDRYQSVLDLDPDDLTAASDRLFIQNYATSRTTANRLTEAHSFGARAAERARPFTRWPAGAVPHSGGPLRIGLVSADLREHPVGHFVEGVMAALAGRLANEVTLFVYDNSNVEDPLTMRLRTHCPRWTSIAALDDQTAAALIHREGLHVLIDLSGHTAGNRLPLFAWKPAPLQLSWLGYCATTGVAAIDGFLADPWMAPVASDAEFTETVVRLPETFLCFQPPRLDVGVAPLPALAAGRLTFGCFNKLNKLNDAVIATWARVLDAVPHSRLMLKSTPLGMASIRQHTRDRFATHGIDAQRLILQGASPRDDHLRAHAQVDIALDPFPYPGGTTSVEALWMGVPVLTLAGSSALARQGVSILQNLGLPDWIAANADDYVACALLKASDFDALSALRTSLRERLLESRLCDSERFAAHFVKALRGLAMALPRPA